MRIVFTATALKESKDRLFPESRHRSRRIRKKLLRRFGAEFRREPAMRNVGGVIYAHPIYKAEIERLTREQEPLGEPYSSILETNRWNLYAR